MSAIFISHSSKDNEAAAELRTLLETQGYASLFLDFDPEVGIPAGREWEQELYGQLRSSQAVIVLCSKDSMASMWCFAEITHAKALGKSIIPIKVGGCVVNTILTSRHVLDLTKDKDDAYRRLWAGLKILGMDSRDTFDWDPKRPPYPGLMAFQQEDAAVFFGREPEIRECLETLNRLRQFGGERLLMVLGASGSGKSSLVRAGIVPRLRLDPERWLLISPFRPGKDPIKELAFALEDSFQHYQTARDWKDIAEQLNASGEGATVSIDALMRQVEDLRQIARKRDATVLLFIDQMEELFTYEKGAGAERLLPLLKAALDTQGTPLMAIGALRSDFLGEFQVCAREFTFKALSIAPIPTERLSRVIEGPAEKAGIRLEGGLTEALRQDTGPEALPLLAFALRELADRYAIDKVLTLDEYRNEFGGLARSVAHAAEAVYEAKNLSVQEEEVLRRAFRSMVRVDEKGAYVRQRANRKSLPSGISDILERFVQARLLVASGQGEERSLEVAHEVLFLNWERLRKWLDEDREFLLWQKRLGMLLTEWERAQESDEALLRGPLLIEAQKWSDQRGQDLSDQERKFISVSRELRERLVREEKERQERELVAVRKLAEAQRERAEEAEKREQEQRESAQKLEEAAQKLRAERAAAEEQARIAEIRRLSAESSSALRIYPQRSLLLAVEGNKVGHPLDGVQVAAAEQSLREALAFVGGRPLVISQSGISQSSAVGISPGNHWLVTGSYDKTARLWNLRVKDPAASPVVLRGHEDTVNAVGISPDNHWLVTGSSDKTARLWDLRAKDPAANPVVLRGHEDRVTAAGISPDSHWLVTGSSDKTARLWDLSAKDPKKRLLQCFNFSTFWSAVRPVVLRGHEDTVSAVGISSDNHWLVTGSWDKTARLWDLSAKDPAANPVVLRGHEYWVTAVAISPDSRWLVTGSMDKTARLWDLNAKDPAANPVVLRGHDSYLEAVAISPDSHWLVTGSSDKTARLWDLRAKDPAASPVVMRGHEDRVSAVGIGPDNQWLVTGSNDKTARLWDLRAKDPAASPVVLRGHEGRVSTAGISPDNHWLVTGGDDGTARLWDLRAKDPATSPVVLRGHEDAVTSVGISPDNHWVVTGSSDKTARLWDLRAKDPAASPVVLRGHEKAVSAVGISPDNHWVVTGSYDKTARLWPLQVKDLIDLARITVGRNFTAKEWALYFQGEPYHKTFPDLPGP